MKSYTLTFFILSFAWSINFCHAQKIYLAVQGLPIQQLNLNSSELKQVLVGPAFDIEVDAYNHRLYYSEYEGIKKSKFNGSNEEMVISDASTINQLAIDLENKKVYWIERNSKSLRRANLDGSELEILKEFPYVTDHSIDIALDVFNNKLYIADRYTGLFKTNLDGTSSEEIAPSIINKSNYSCINVHPEKELIFWAVEFISGQKSTLLSADLNGENIDTLYESSNFDTVRDIGVDTENDQIYILEANELKRINIDGSNLEIIKTMQFGLPPDKMALDFGLTTKTEDISLANLPELILYPNPARQLVTISLDEKINQNTQIEKITIYNSSEKAIKSYNGLKNGQKEINLGSLPSGIYLVEVLLRNQSKLFEKLIVH